MVYRFHVSRSDAEKRHPPAAKIPKTFRHVGLCLQPQQMFPLLSFMPCAKSTKACGSSHSDLLASASDLHQYIEHRLQLRPTSLCSLFSKLRGFGGVGRIASSCGCRGFGALLLLCLAILLIIAVGFLVTLSLELAIRSVADSGSAIFLLTSSSSLRFLPRAIMPWAGIAFFEALGTLVVFGTLGVLRVLGVLGAFSFWAL